MKQHGNTLSPREREVVDLMAKGKPHKQMADEMHISIKTVAEFMRRICEKLGARNNKELLFLLAMNSGGAVIARVWNVNEGQNLQPCWAPVTESTPPKFKTYLVVEAVPEYAA